MHHVPFHSPEDTKTRASSRKDFPAENTVKGNRTKKLPLIAYEQPLPGSRPLANQGAVICKSEHPAKLFCLLHPS